MLPVNHLVSSLGHQSGEGDFCWDEAVRDHSDLRGLLLGDATEYVAGLHYPITEVFIVHHHPLGELDLLFSSLPLKCLSHSVSRLYCANKFFTSPPPPSVCLSLFCRSRSVRFLSVSFSEGVPTIVILVSVFYVSRLFDLVLEPKPTLSFATDD